MDNTDLDLRIFDQFDEFLKGCRGRTKWSAMNSIHHLVMAKEISKIDPAMAAFRSVCAEEEAATALISSLKVQKYPGSEHLNFRSHADKHAVIIFVSTVMA